MIKKNIFDYDTSKYASLTEAVKAEREARAIKADYQRNVKIISDAVKPAIDAEALAAAIVRSGEKRRGQAAPEFDDTPAGQTAKAVINAGRKARNEPEIK
jgi:hypothetical protein